MRRAGVLMPLSSLPSRHGIGDMGQSSYDFIDMLKDSKITIWQILPLNPVGYGNSPYQPYSSFAGDEIYISLDKLHEEGYLSSKVESFNDKASKVDYQAVREFKENHLKRAYKTFKDSKSTNEDKEYKGFIEQEWVYEYAVYLTLKKSNSLLSWNEWPKDEKEWIDNKKLSLDKYQDDINYEMFIQYIFYRQWIDLKEYANKNNIKVMGDMPFYVGVDSLDVWRNKECFLLDEDGNPEFVAGVPPDFFSDLGQRWGNPIYNWEHIKETDYKIWIDRIAYNFKLFDIIRIDHFRAFDTYWSIPSSSKTAQKGKWIEAPGYEVINKIYKEIPQVDLIAEDLGDLRPQVLELRDHFNLPGMLIGQFALDTKTDEPDFKGYKNLIIYTGTHDNQTMMGWYKSQTYKDKRAIKRKLKLLGYKDLALAKRFISYILDSDADTAILPVQDILAIGDEGRINTPGTLGTPNWEWKLTTYKKLIKKMGFYKKEILRSKRYKD